MRIVNGNQDGIERSARSLGASIVSASATHEMPPNRKPGQRGASRRLGGRRKRGKTGKRMLVVNAMIAVPDDEFHWSYARAGGPGGQNVNKVSSKAVLRWNIAA